MNPGIIAPKIIVVIKTIIKTEVFTIDVALSPYSGFKVKINAKATDPLITPATVTTKSSKKETFHFLSQHLTK